MAEKIDIYKGVMSKLGNTNPPTMTDVKANEVVIFNQEYPKATAKLLSVRFWSFLSTQEQLPEESREDSNDANWLYKFPLPRGYLRLNGAYSTNFYSGPNIRYSIKNGYIFVNVPELFLDYVSKLCEAKMPVWFTDYLEYYIARRMCIPVTGDTQLLAILKMDEKEAKDDALSADVCQQEQSDLPTDVFIGCRG